MQLLVERGEIGERGGGVSVRDALQDGKVDERVLLLRLYHVVSLLSHPTDKVANIDEALVFESVKAVVQGYDCARPTNTSTAMTRCIQHTMCAYTSAYVQHVSVWSPQLNRKLWQGFGDLVNLINLPI